MRKIRNPDSRKNKPVRCARVSASLSLSVYVFMSAGLQFEVFVQFFIGTFEDSPSLLSDLRLAANRNLSSPGGFWSVLRVYLNLNAPGQTLLNFTSVRANKFILFNDCKIYQVLNRTEALCKLL